MGYGDDQGLQDWLDARGYALPSGAPDLEQLRQIGSDWLDATYGARFRGTPTDGVDQDRAWPRKGAVVYGSTVDSSKVPKAITDASYMAAWQEASEEGSLFGSIATGAGQVRREKVGPIEQEFFAAKDPQGPYDPNAAPVGSLMIPQIEQMLKPFMVLADYSAGIDSIGPGVKL